MENVKEGYRRNNNPPIAFGDVTAAPGQHDTERSIMNIPAPHIKEAIIYRCLENASQPSLDPNSSTAVLSFHLQILNFFGE
jgi:hypothetical protein